MNFQSTKKAICFGVNEFTVDYVELSDDHASARSSGFHYHDAGELLIVQSGKSSVFIGDKTYAIEGSYIVYFEKGVSHCNIALPKHKYSRFCLPFEEHYFLKDVELPSKSFVIPISEEELEAVLAPTELLYKYFSKATERTPIMLKRRGHLLELLLDEITVILNNGNDNTLSYDESYIPKVCEYLSIHFNESISLSQLSEYFFVSKAKFTKDFKNKCGVSVGDFITALRIRAAKKQLANTDVPVWKIAEECGYKSSSFFVRHFTKVVGMSPTQYRKMINGSH